MKFSLAKTICLSFVGVLYLNYPQLLSQNRPIGYYCEPYTTSFRDGRFYLPTSNTCHYVSPSLSGDRYGDIYRGVPGAATLVGGHFLGSSSDSIQFGDNIISSVLGTSYFVAIYEINSNSDVTVFRDHFQTGLSPAPHADFGLLPWRYGISLRWPLLRDRDRPVNLAFGDDWVDDCGGLVKFHAGTDLEANEGELVFAAHGGVVAAVVDATDQGWGKAVTLLNNEGENFTTVYWHIVPSVIQSQRVSRGDPIGTVADLGTRTHFHFGVRLAEYSNISNRGALPQQPCGGDPQFPALFVDPLILEYELFGDGFEAGTLVRWPD